MRFFYLLICFLCACSANTKMTKNSSIGMDKELKVQGDFNKLIKEIELYFTSSVNQSLHMKVTDNSLKNAREYIKQVKSSISKMDQKISNFKKRLETHIGYNHKQRGLKSLLYISLLFKYYNHQIISIPTPLVFDDEMKGILKSELIKRSSPLLNKHAKAHEIFNKKCISLKMKDYCETVVNQIK